jgi:curli biogenesis system outer membrane secretion channel CsgG
MQLQFCCYLLTRFHGMLRPSSRHFDRGLLWIRTQSGELQLKLFSPEALKFHALFALGLNCLSSAAQDRPAPIEVKPTCQSVIATVMVGKVTCTAALCNTGSSQGGFAGLFSQAMNRGAIDGASFSTGVGAQLATTLKQTGCFEVLDAAGLEETRKEMEALGKVMPPPKAVDYLVKASITKAEFVVDESGFIGFKKTTATSSITLDTKLVNAVSGAVSEAGSYDATLERTSSGVSVPFYRSSSDAALRGTPFADVARDAIVKATTGLTSRILSQPPASGVSAAGKQPPQPAQTPASAPQ